MQTRGGINVIGRTQCDSLGGTDTRDIPSINIAELNTVENVY